MNNSDFPLFIVIRESQSFTFPCKCSLTCAHAYLNFLLLEFGACPILYDSPDGKQLDTIPSRYWNCIAPSLIKIAMQMFVSVFWYVIGCIHSRSSVSIFRKMMSKRAHFKTSSTTCALDIHCILYVSLKIFKFWISKQLC